MDSIQVRNMKEIPCKDIEVLKGTEVYDRLLGYIENYRSRSVPGWILSIIVLPPLAVIVPAAFLLFYLFIGDKIAVAVGHAVSGFLTGLLSEVVAEIISSLLSYIIEALFLAPPAALLVIFASMFFQYLANMVKKQPNVAKALYFADNADEVERITTANIFTGIAWWLLKRYWNMSFGLIKKYNLDYAKSISYKNGAVISKTNTQTMAFTSLCSQSGPGTELKIRMEDVNENVVMVIFTGGIPIAIAVFDRQYKDELVQKIDFLCPNAFEQVEA